MYIIMHTYYVHVGPKRKGLENWIHIYGHLVSILIVQMFNISLNHFSFLFYFMGIEKKHQGDVQKHNENCSFSWYFDFPLFLCLWKIQVLHLWFGASFITKWRLISVIGNLSKKEVVWENKYLTKLEKGLKRDELAQCD